MHMLLQRTLVTPTTISAVPAQQKLQQETYNQRPCPKSHVTLSLTVLLSALKKQNPVLQALPAKHTSKLVQLACEDDISRPEHCHFCLPAFTAPLSASLHMLRAHAGLLRTATASDQ